MPGKPSMPMFVTAALTPAAGNVWLERIQEGYQPGAFEAVLPIFYEKTATLLDYLDPRTILFWSDANRSRAEMAESHWQLGRDGAEDASANEWQRPPAELFADPDQVQEHGRRFQQVLVNALARAFGRSPDLRSRRHQPQ